MFHSFYLLIIFVPFSGNKNYISLFCQHTSSTNRFLTVALLVDDSMQIGYLTHKQVQPGRFGKQYIAILKKYTEQV